MDQQSGFEVCVFVAAIGLIRKYDSVLILIFMQFAVSCLSVSENHFLFERGLAIILFEKLIKQTLHEVFEIRHLCWCPIRKRWRGIHFPIRKFFLCFQLCCIYFLFSGSPSKNVISHYSDMGCSLKKQLTFLNWTSFSCIQLRCLLYFHEIFLWTVISLRLYYVSIGASFISHVTQVTCLWKLES